MKFHFIAKALSDFTVETRNSQMKILEEGKKSCCWNSDYSKIKQEHNVQLLFYIAPKSANINEIYLPSILLMLIAFP